MPSPPGAGTGLYGHCTYVDGVCRPNRAGCPPEGVDPSSGGGDRSTPMP